MTGAADTTELAYALSSEFVDDDDVTRPFRVPEFFGVPCRQPPHPAHLPLPDQRVAGSREVTTPVGRSR